MLNPFRSGRLLLSFLFFLLFFILGLFTLPHYGINWDTINHLPRGQAYLHYFLTGSKDYSDLQRFFHDWEDSDQWYWQNPKSLLIDADIPVDHVPRRSLYQTDYANFDFHNEVDKSGHPPLSDILSSVFNLMLFQKLRLMNDIDSYRVYGVILAASLIGLLFWWVSGVYGKFAGFIASLSLALYPLFWAESHFNTEKDVPETVYWSFMLFSFWRGITGNSWRWVLASGVFFGLALGTKFNILFSAFVILPWLMVYTYKLFRGRKIAIGNFFGLYKKIILVLAFVPFIGLGILIITWPYLWTDPFSRLISVVFFYERIGLTPTDVDLRFLGPFRINTYPVQAVLYTTPVVIFVFSLIGLPALIAKIRRGEDSFSLLVLLWFLVPIARVSLPGTNIYGGTRQIMEYIPALAVLAGLGGIVLRDYIYFIVKKFAVVVDKGTISEKIICRFAGVVVVAFFIPIFIRLIQIHPYENVYFNSLIGGLYGAVSRDFPSWGNSYGAVYRQGVGWINENVPQGARVAYAYELIPNIPRLWFRSDIVLSNEKNRSGSLRLGEYVITLTYDRQHQSYYDAYVERFLEPVYHVDVDNVPILKIWKNDVGHLKAGFEIEEEIPDVVYNRFAKNPSFQTGDKGEVRFQDSADIEGEALESLKYEKTANFQSVEAYKYEDGGSLIIDLGDVYYLSKINAKFKVGGCAALEHAYSQLSVDGVDWKRTTGLMPEEDWGVFVFGKQPEKESFFQPFAAEQARYIDYRFSPGDACFGNITSVSVFHLKGLR